MFKLVKKLKLVKCKLRIWNKEKFGNINKVKNLDTTIEKLQNDNYKNYNHVVNDKISRLNKKRECLIEYQQKYWFQRAKTKFINEGDRNTKYFHRVATGRRNRKTINNIQKDNGLWVNKEEDIMSVFVNEYKKRFHASNTNHNQYNNLIQVITEEVSERDNDELTKPVSNSDIKNAIYSIGAEKSPGPDGMSAGFFHHYWDIVGPAICKAIKSFFLSGKLLEQVNHTFITLIPKKDNPISTNDYRPISLCSIVYKVIAKILASRLSKILPKLIHPLQSAFVQKRAIQDNILIGHEVFHGFRTKKGKEGFMAIKLDMKKAYDRIEWKYIRVVLEKFGFCNKFTNWIMECISSVSYSILINDKPTDPFTPGRGLRQGDSISSLIFNLGAEVLDRNIQFESNRNRKSIGFPITRNGTTIPFLAYADDIIIFSKASVSAASKILDILNEYCIISGQKINLQKSAFQTSKNVDNRTKRQIQLCLGIPSSNDLEKYLGCLLLMVGLIRRCLKRLSTIQKTS